MPPPPVNTSEILTQPSTDGLDHIDDAYQKHVEDGTILRFIIYRMFMHQNELPDGTTSQQVDGLTLFKQIEFLERINQKPALLGNSDVDPHEISAFIERINKFDFQTADDLDLVA